MKNKLYNDLLDSMAVSAGCASVYTFPAIFIYLSNKEQFAVKTAVTLAVVFAVFALTGIIIGAMVFACRKLKCFQTVLVTPAALAICGVIQYHFSSTFFPNYLTTDFLTEDLILLVSFNTALLIAPFFAVYRFREFFRNNIRKISLVLFLTQLAYGLLPLTTHSEKLKSEFDFVDYTFSEKDKFVFANSDNIIVLVVDSMGENIAKEMLAKYPELNGTLKDFTMCDKLKSPFARTMYAVPEMLCGISYPSSSDNQPDDDHAEVLNRAFRTEHSLFQALKKIGFRTEGYSFFLQTICYAPDVIDNSIPITQEIQKDSLLLVFSTAFTKFLPLKTENSEMYSNLAFLNPQQVSNDENGETVTEIFDRQFYRELSEKFTVGNNPKVFKYLHIHGAHDPVHTDEELRVTSDKSRINQLRGSFKIVELLLDKLKQHSLYDNATVVITGDHSEVYTPETICFIKRRNTVRKAMAINSTPHYIRDIAGTILDEYGISSPLPLIKKQEINQNPAATLSYTTKYANLSQWKKHKNSEIRLANDFIPSNAILKDNRIMIESFPDNSHLLEKYLLRIISDDDMQTHHLYAECSTDGNFRYLRSEKLAIPDGVYRIQLESFYKEHYEEEHLRQVTRRVFDKFLIAEKGTLKLSETNPVEPQKKLEIGKVLNFQLMKSYPMLHLPPGSSLKSGYVIIPSGTTLQIALASGEEGHVIFTIGNKHFEPCYLNVSASNGFKQRLHITDVGGTDIFVPVKRSPLDERLYVNFEFEIPQESRKTLPMLPKVKITRIKREGVSP